MRLHQMNLYLYRTIWLVGNAIILFGIIRFFIIGVGVVDGHSMDPTMHSGQLFIVNKIAYMLHQPRIGDIVQAYRPDAPNELIVKRIVEIPNPYLYFVVGDNVNASTDSRNFGPVHRSLIKGKIMGQ